MTIEEVSEKYNVSISSLKTNFKRTQERINKKYGVWIAKIGRGVSASYIETEIDNNRALTLYEEKDNTMFYMDDEIINLDQWELMVLISLLIKPNLVFRGNAKMLLEYLKKPVTPTNLKAIAASIKRLNNKDYVLYAEDNMDGYFLLGLKRKVEKKIIDIQLDMVRKCHEIAEINNKREWIPLLKVWAAAIYFHEEGTFTVEDIKSLTGLPASSIKDTKKLLKDNNIVLFKKECKKLCNGEVVCIGSSADVNVIWDRK